jgi:putative ABC transport system permease protein
MYIQETINSAVISLKSNKLRTFLTMLGVIIGVFAVVSLVSLIQGVGNFITDRFNALGTNLIIVAPGRASLNQDPAVSFSNNKLTKKHVDLIDQHVGDLIVGVTPNIRLSKTLEYKSKNFLGYLVGASHKAFDIIDIELIDGRFFTKTEENEGAKVAVIGPLVKKELFGSSNALGQEFKMSGESFEVIGLLSKKGINSDERVIIPYTTAEDVYDLENYSGITLKAKNTDEIDYVMREVEIALLEDLKADDFTVLSQQNLLSSVQNILGIVSSALGGVAAISLLVGGIGIMNIMLVSVTERTREIGLRKALGATSGNIGFQFVTEAVFISVVGGILGLLFGWALTFFAQRFFPAQMPWWSIALALVFSAIVGIIFGTYPALQASKKDPIEALRFE